MRLYVVIDSNNTWVTGTLSDSPTISMVRFLTSGGLFYLLNAMPAKDFFVDEKSENPVNKLIAGMLFAKEYGFEIKEVELVVKKIEKAVLNRDSYFVQQQIRPSPKDVVCLYAVVTDFGKKRQKIVARTVGLSAEKCVCELPIECGEILFGSHSKKNASICRIECNVKLGEFNA